MLKETMRVLGYLPLRTPEDIIMGDMGDIFRDIRAYKKRERERRAIGNMKTLANHGIEYHEWNGGYILLIYPKGSKAPASFYPTTGRWTFRGRTYRGGANSFVHWLRKMEK